MIESLVKATALPNLHPAVVHLPIVLIPLALIFDVVGAALFGQKWTRPAATALWVSAAFSAWFAVWAGEQAADGLTDVPPQVQPHIGEHSDWAHYTLYAVAVLGLLRLVLHFHPKFKETRSAYVGFALIASAALFPLVRTADLGGSLVYRHGLGVGTSEDHLHSAEMEAEIRGSSQVTEHAGHETAGAGNGLRSADPEALVVAEDGTLTWTPRASQGGGLETLFSPPPGQDFSAVNGVEEDDGDGLLLEVSGEATLLFTENFSDVQVEALLEVVDFQGEIGLVHHASEADGGFFTISTDDIGELFDMRDGKLNQLAREMVRVPDGPFKLAVSSTGRHLKGLLDGATVVHGHVAPGAGRGVGLLFRGRGTVRVMRVSAIPLDSD